MRVSYGSKKPMIIRIVFVVSTIFVVVFSAPLVTKGLTQLSNGVGTVYDSSVVSRIRMLLLYCRAFELDAFSCSREQELIGILDNVEEFANSLDEVALEFQPLSQELLSQLANDSFCPGVDLDSVTGLNFSSIVNDAVTSLGVDNFTLPQAEEARETLDTAQQTAVRVETTSENISIQDWQSLIFIVPFSIFAFLFLVGVVLVWFDRNVTWYICILSWVVLPLFIILVVICALCSGAIVIAASANAGKQCHALVLSRTRMFNLLLSNPLLQISVPAGMIIHQEVHLLK